MSGGAARTKGSLGSPFWGTIGLFSSIGVTASALGGVIIMSKTELSTPTGGGRPRGRRRLKDALARFCIRQSDPNITRLIIFSLLPTSCVCTGGPWLMKRVGCELGPRHTRVIKGDVLC